MTNIPKIFGSMVFGDAAMKQYLPAEAYRALKNTMENGSMCVSCGGVHGERGGTDVVV